MLNRDVYVLGGMRAAQICPYFFFECLILIILNGLPTVFIGIFRIPNKFIFVGLDSPTCC